MSWRVEFRPEIEQDMTEAAAWYESRQPGLGADFIEEVICVWDALAKNPLLHSRHHPLKNIRWRYPDRFPYRIIYEVWEAQQTVIVIAVFHAARDNSGWQQRLKDR